MKTSVGRGKHVGRIPLGRSLPQQYTLRPEKSNEFLVSLHIEIHVAAKGHGREARQSRQRPQDVALVHRE